MRKKIPTIVLVFLIAFLQLPLHSDAWTTVTDNYDYGYDTKMGGTWNEFDYSKETGNIEIVEDQFIGTSKCHIKIGEKITTPDWGGDNWRLKIKVKYRRSYAVWASWLNSVRIVIKVELHDSSHGIDWESTLFSKTTTSYGEDVTELAARNPYDILPEGTTYYIVYHLYLEFNGWSYMHKNAGSTYDTARFDLMYFKYEFTNVQYNPPQ
ncbi:MAG: hypothetical protein GF309_13390 [Candidatus Lokiarchaeota archaeon]|nr:hypothetical protein [Candidatus Lokiarchaeota archaeon]